MSCPVIVVNMCHCVIKILRKFFLAKGKTTSECCYNSCSALMTKVHSSEVDGSDKNFLYKLSYLQLSRLFKGIKILVRVLLFLEKKDEFPFCHD